ncbi:SRPBCC domain-containing protein [Sinomonas sp. ASV486]|uniref:SRPBCC family protein n=1 Tax=Sinomonas sp. ASV486 TaxID=3051170 RepID=UPI0027DC3059|nr:SRPBCC domain-containing protein [Sinomonas sp. ASV486]MDQ4489155.1 SRPBCC domain-containing protein [Sinomonas sp. ASV486]
MVDILHRIGVAKSSPDDVYAALTTIEGLSGWWARNTTGKTDVGGVIAFRFVPGGFDMKVIESVPGKKVLWEVVDGPAEWIGTHVSWDLSQAGDYTIVLFAHEGWAEPVEFMHHCSTKWATYLLSLKQLLESGAGSPDPDDQQISDWH